MDDEEAIAHLTDLNPDGVAISYETNGNPFRLVSEETLFANREQQNRTVRLLQESKKKKSLQQRSDSVQSHLPPCVSRGSAMRAASTKTISREIPKPREKKVKHNPLMSEFIQQKRDIFLVQLFIDRKNREIRKFEREKIQIERDSVETEATIAEKSAKYKTAATQLEARLARSRRNSELAAQRHMQLTKELRTAQQNVSVIKSDISKNEDLLEQYRPYLAFLNTFVQPDEDLGVHFYDPMTLVDELHQIENENLFIIQHCNHLEGILNGSISVLNEEISDTIRSESEVMKEISELPKPHLHYSRLTEEKTQELAAVDQKLKDLGDLIVKCYVNCFGQGAAISPILMLERIENMLESMYEKCQKVDKEFLKRKQHLKDKERLEQQRKERNERRNQEQQRKIEQAIERAKRPIPRRTGRPINTRVVPIKAKKVDDETTKAKVIEQKAEQRMLFANSDDEM